jgi:hypothetical protein
VALTGDLDNALLVIEEAVAQIERPEWEERQSYAEILRLKGWMLSLNPSTGRAASTRKCGNCARRSALHGSGRAKANAQTRMSCWLQFTVGLLKASTPRICWRRRRFSPNLERIALDIERGHLLVADFDPVSAVVEFASFDQTGLDRGAGDQFHHRESVVSGVHRGVEELEAVINALATLRRGSSLLTPARPK